MGEGRKQERKEARKQERKEGKDGKKKGDTKGGPKGGPKGGKGKDKGKKGDPKGGKDNKTGYDRPKNQDPSRYNPKRLCRAFQKFFGENGCTKKNCKYLHLQAKNLADYNMIPKGRTPKSDDGLPSTASESEKPDGGKAAVAKAKAETKKKNGKKRSDSRPPSGSEKE